MKYFNAKVSHLKYFVRLHKVHKSNLYNSVTLAERIKAQSKKQGTQLKDMLGDLSLSRSTLSNLRSGRMMAADSLASIADYLNCSMDYLMGRTDDPALQRLELTDVELEKVEEYVRFLRSQR